MMNRKLIAWIMTVALLCTALILISSSDSDYREAQLERYRKMQERTIDVTIDHSGGYVLKSTKLYVREVVGVDDDDIFILGPGNAWIQARTNRCSHTI